MRLPKLTEEQKAARSSAIAAAYEKATAVPLATARLCLQALELTEQAAASGNRNSTSDAGVGALLAKAGLDAAVMNVRINLPSVKEGIQDRDQPKSPETGRVCRAAGADRRRRSSNLKPDRLGRRRCGQRRRANAAPRRHAPFACACAAGSSGAPRRVETGCQAYGRITTTIARARQHDHRDADQHGAAARSRRRRCAAPG